MKRADVAESDLGYDVLTERREGLGTKAIAHIKKGEFACQNQRLRDLLWSTLKITPTKSSRTLLF